MPTVHASFSPSGLAALIGAAVLTSCGPDRTGTERVALNNMVEELPVITVAERPLDREQLLLATMRAASAFAAGSDDPEAQRKLDGKRFELRMRFGCRSDEDQARGWRFDEEDRTLRLRITPDISEDDPIAAAIAGEQSESVEGFWLRRPWMLTASCPARKPAAEPAGETQDAKIVPTEDKLPSVRIPRVGLAQFFASSDSRTTRRKRRPYEATIVLDDGQERGDQGYDFILSGRLRALTDRRVIACVAENPDLPPDCIISVHIDRVRIEHPGNRELIAEWTV